MMVHCVLKSETKKLSMADKGRPVLRMTSAFNSFLIVVHPSLVLCSKKLKQNRVKAQSA